MSEDEVMGLLGMKRLKDGNFEAYDRFIKRIEVCAFAID